MSGRKFHIATSEPAPVDVDLPKLLELAASRGVRVWAVDRAGKLKPLASRDGSAASPTVLP